jgi:hypothetical protein
MWKGTDWRFRLETLLLDVGGYRLETLLLDVGGYRLETLLLDVGRYRLETLLLDVAGQSRDTGTGNDQILEFDSTGTVTLWIGALVGPEAYLDVAHN